MTTERQKIFNRVNKKLLRLELAAKAECKRIHKELRARQKDDPFLKDHEVFRVRFQFFWKEGLPKADYDEIATQGEVFEDLLGVPVAGRKHCRLFQILLDDFGNDSHLERKISDIGRVWCDIVTWHQGYVEL